MLGSLRKYFLDKSYGHLLHHLDAAADAVAFAATEDGIKGDEHRGICVFDRAGLPAASVDAEIYDADQEPRTVATGLTIADRAGIKTDAGMAFHQYRHADITTAPDIVALKGIKRLTDIAREQGYSLTVDAGNTMKNGGRYGCMQVIDAQIGFIFKPMSAAPV